MVITVYKFQEGQWVFNVAEYLILQNKTGKYGQRTRITVTFSYKNLFAPSFLNFG